MPAVLELKEMDFEEVILFLMELFAAILIFILFIPVFKWLFMLTILITESCLWFFYLSSTGCLQTGFLIKNL